MTARTPYKPEGWPTADDLGLMSSQDVNSYEEEVRAAIDGFDALVSRALSRRGLEDSDANQRLVVAYRALKAWEMEKA